MSRVITFSRTFPAYHPRAGEPTYFVEKIYKSILRPTDHVPITGIEAGLSLFALADAPPKHHTIRAGHRWKVGDWFSPRVWSGKPYNSKQIQFAPDIQIKKVWDFKIIKQHDGILQWYSYTINGKVVQPPVEVWANDGLTYNEFCDWFKMDSAKKDIHFAGQIICWNENIKY